MPLPEPVVIVPIGLTLQEHYAALVEADVLKDQRIQELKLQLYNSNNQLELLEKQCSTLSNNFQGALIAKKTYKRKLKKLSRKLQKLSILCLQKVETP